MNVQTTISFSLGVVIIAGMLSNAQVQAQRAEGSDREQQQTRQAQAVRQSVFDKIQDAQMHISEEDFVGAIAILDRLSTHGDLSNYERSRVLQSKGFAHYSAGDVKQAIDAYREILGIPELEEQSRKQTIYTLAQLSTAQEQYNEALQFLEEWFALEPNPAPEPYILLAQNLYQLGRFEEMIEPIEAAMAVSESLGKQAKEDWYVLLNFAYFQQEDYLKVRDIQKILIKNWPSKRYWISLAGAYAELGEEDKFFASYETAFEQGFLEKESELVTMAQLYMQHDAPYKAARLLQAEIDHGRISPSAANYRLLAQAWSMAREDEKAIPALQEASQLSADGELDLRLANAYLNLSRFGKCVEAVRLGIEKGGLRHPDDAQTTLGMCTYNLHEYQVALAAFNRAKRTPRSTRIAGQWINVIRRELQRNEQILIAEEAARKQIHSLEQRRQTADSS